MTVERNIDIILDTQAGAFEISKHEDCTIHIHFEFYNEMLN